MVLFLLSATAFSQTFEGRKYRQLIESDTLSYSTLLGADSTFLAHRIDWKTNEMRFYKYNDSAASILLLSEQYNMSLRVKYINDEGNKVYEPRYIKYISIDDTPYKGEVTTIVHNEKENWFFFGLRNDIRGSFFLYYVPLE